MSGKAALGQIARVAVLLALGAAFYLETMPVVKDSYVASMLGALVFIILAPLVLDHLGSRRGGRTRGERE
ncbi:hypothetical protein [Sphingomonas sp. S2-65]|uniref:hypothetical protein n=1 Tax=Sphingomonas sp. S2-65 TaxID=2903960 RepID=UPI001F1B30CD|nr:hypothetical protein [Sphingomonas sp. S2-65]UYY58078.1 hypothetical protein LZ586_15640 [Sphingomonas sp. S2-65]